MDATRRVVLHERPRYVIPTARCFRVVESPAPEPGEGDILIRTQWLGIEPYLLGKVKRASGQAPVRLGDPMEGPAVGQVLASRHPDFAEGDRVTGLWAWSERALSDAHHIRKLPGELRHSSHALGALGYTGFGAWLSVGDLGAARPGDTVVVGAATGGLGQMVGQMAAIRGYRAVGIAGGPEKCRIASERFGFETCIDRHHNPDFAAQLAAACPNGIDVYVEVIGGRLFHTVWPLLNRGARVVVAGLMAEYSLDGHAETADRSMQMLSDINLKRIRLLGLVVFDHMSTRYSAFKKDMLDWLANDRIRPMEYVVEGLENAPDALQGVFEGRNLGKSVVHVGA